MITALDTHVLLDVLIGSEPQVTASRRALADARARGAVVISEPVFAELAAAFDGDSARLAGFLEALGADLIQSGEGALLDAGRRWRRWRKAKGSRRRVLPDFWIASHALHHADRLLARDRGF